MVSLADSAGVPLSVTITLNVYVPVACVVTLHVNTPVEELIVAPEGAPDRL